MPITQKSLIPWCSSGEEEGCPSLCFWVFGAAGGFFCTWVRHCVRVSMGRGAPFSEMNWLFQLAYEGFQAVEGEVGRWLSCCWGLGQAGALARWWESLEVCAGCVCSVQQLTVGGEKQVLANPTTTSPTPREGRSNGGGRGCSRPCPCPCPVWPESRKTRDSVSHKQAQSSGFLSCVSFAWCGSPLPPDPDGSSHVHAHTDTQTQKLRTHRRAHTHICVLRQKRVCAPPRASGCALATWAQLCLGRPGGWGQMPCARVQACPFS